MSAVWKLCLCGGVLAGLAGVYYGTLFGGLSGLASLACLAAAGDAGWGALSAKWRELGEARQRRREHGAAVKDSTEGRRAG